MCACKLNNARYLIMPYRLGMLQLMEQPCYCDVSYVERKKNARRKYSIYLIIPKDDIKKLILVQTIS